MVNVKKNLAACAQTPYLWDSDDTPLPPPISFVRDDPTPTSDVKQADIGPARSAWSFWLIALVAWLAGVLAPPHWIKQVCTEKRPEIYRVAERVDNGFDRIAEATARFAMHSFGPLRWPF